MSTSTIYQYSKFPCIVQNREFCHILSQSVYELTAIPFPNLSWSNKPVKQRKYAVFGVDHWFLVRSGLARKTSLIDIFIRKIPRDCHNLCIFVRSVPKCIELCYLRIYDTKIVVTYFRISCETTFIMIVLNISPQILCDSQLKKKTLVWLPLYTFENNESVRQLK